MARKVDKPGEIYSSRYIYIYIQALYVTKQQKTNEWWNQREGANLWYLVVMIATSYNIGQASYVMNVQVKLCQFLNPVHLAWVQ